MERGLLDEFATFAAVAEERSFRKAALRLRLSPSAVSYSIRHLEDRLQTRLLSRTTRSVALTEAGERLLGELRPALRQIEEVMCELDVSSERPSGRLRLYVTHLASRTVVAPIWREYRRRFPDVRLEIEVGEASIDFAGQGFDAAIWSRNRAPLDMIAVQMMGPQKVAVVASPHYLSGRAIPERPDDLLAHDCIEYRRNPRERSVPWHFDYSGKIQKIAVRGALIVNNHEVNLTAALDGFGIAYSLEGYALELVRSGRLVRVLEEWSPDDEGLYLYYPGRRQVPPPLRAFIKLATVELRDRSLRTVRTDPVI